jgi:type III secretion system FlhB-like substrate exporter
VAKGQRLMAARIRDLGREHGVPIIEDVPLARALFGRPIGSDVPAHLYRAVARILVIVQRAHSGRRGPVASRPVTGRPVADNSATSPAPRPDGRATQTEGTAE